MRSTPLGLQRKEPKSEPRRHACHLATTERPLTACARAPWQQRRAPPPPLRTGRLSEEAGVQVAGTRSLLPDKHTRPGRLLAASPWTATALPRQHAEADYLRRRGGPPARGEHALTRPDADPTQARRGRDPGKGTRSPGLGGSAADGARPPGVREPRSCPSPRSSPGARGAGGAGAGLNPEPRDARRAAPGAASGRGLPPAPPGPSDAWLAPAWSEGVLRAVG